MGSVRTNEREPSWSPVYKHFSSLVFIIWSTRRSLLYWPHCCPSVPRRTFKDAFSWILYVTNSSYRSKVREPLLRTESDTKRANAATATKKLSFQLKIWKNVYLSFVTAAHSNFPVAKVFPSQKLLMLIKEVLKLGSFCANFGSM